MVQIEHGRGLGYRHIIYVYIYIHSSTVFRLLAEFPRKYNWEEKH